MFGRRKRVAARDTDAEAAAAAEAAAEAAAARGPWDASDVDLDAPAPARVDLGGLLVTGREGIELRLQADQSSGAVSAVLLATPDAAVELKAFAAPKSGGMWAELRREITAEATRLGGTADEGEGPYGPQLRLQVPVKTSDGRAGVQASRVVGIEGPRWLLRATFLGAAARDVAADSPLEQALRDVIVVRGGGPMGPREPLPLQLPPDAST